MPTWTHKVILLNVIVLNLQQVLCLLHFLSSRIVPGEEWKLNTSNIMFSCTTGTLSGWYDVPKGMVFNFPARISSTGEYEVVKDLELSEESKLSIKECIDVCNYQCMTIYDDRIFFYLYLLPETFTPGTGLNIP